MAAATPALAADAALGQGPLSPSALAASPDGTRLFVACETGHLLTVDLRSGLVVRATPLPPAPSGIAMTNDGRLLYVTCGAPASVVCIIEAATGTVVGQFPAGHTALAPVLSPDGKALFVCNRFDNAVEIFDLATRRSVARIAVPREPVAAALTPDGRHLFVANHLHNGRADADYVAASVSVIDVAGRRIAKELRLPNGSGLLRDVRISPNGRYACVTHLLSRFHLPTTQLERGWINTNALTLIDVAAVEVVNTVLLDTVTSGAANPWAASWSADGRTLCVTHAGTHEVSVIAADALLKKLLVLPCCSGDAPSSESGLALQTIPDVPNDLGFLVGLRRRVKLEGNGPRAIAVVGSTAYVANYFSDTVSVVDLSAPGTLPVSIALGPPPKISEVRRGEILWNDASICFQGWQSCSSCHSSDARVDGLNWDLLNDGIANPKNAKSLLYSHRTPPAMWTGVREDARAAVRAGLKYILYTSRPPADAQALDAYLDSLRPIPSPHLVRGQLSAAAQRGQKIFASEKAACVQCHSGEYFTDLKPHDVATAGAFDLPAEAFDTPTLIELWRTAPYLHDGSAATMREVLTTRNADNRHGDTRHLTPQQIDDLAEYLLSL